MKLAVFNQYVERNPFNAMDRSDGEAFIKQRQKQINAWRKLVASSIEINYGDYDEVPQDFFDYGPQNIEKK